MCEHEGTSCPGRGCRCECMNCTFASSRRTAAKVNRQREESHKAGVQAAKHTYETGHATRIHRWTQSHVKDPKTYFDWSCIEDGEDRCPSRAT